MEKRDGATSNDPKLSDSGPAAPGESTAARGEGAACAGLDGGAHAVTEPDKLEAAPPKLNAKAAVRCSAWLGAGETAKAAAERIVRTTQPGVPIPIVISDKTLFIARELELLGMAVQRL